MSQGFARGARFAALAGVVLALSVPVLAQQPVAAVAQPSVTDQAPAQSPAKAVRPLSLDDAVKLALEQNLGIQVARVNPQLQDLSITQVRGSWVPTLSSSVSTNSSNSPVSNAFAGAASKLTSDQFTAKVGLNQTLPTGGNYSLGWDSSRSTSNNLFSTKNPTLGAELSFQIQQPFLRNFAIDNVRQQLQLAKKGREVTDVQLQQTVLATTRNVKNAYWALSYAISSLDVQRQSLALAERSLKDARSKVTIGTMAPIDIIEAQAEVAAREENVILAEAQVDQSEDQLRALIFDPKMPDFWNVKLQLTDQPTYQTQPIDIDAAVKTALEQRTDLIQARKGLEQTDISIKYYKNQTLPDLNVQANYSASAQGGTRSSVDWLSAPTPIVTQLSKIGYGSVLKSLVKQDFPTWSIGVQVGYPIGRSAAEINLTRAKLQRSQTETQMRNQELQVATEVRNLGRSVNTNLKRVEATRASRELAERRLEAEQKKLAAGISTSFLVFQAQRDLAQAKNAELSAVLDYTRSLVNFEIGQRAPSGGQ